MQNSIVPFRKISLSLSLVRSIRHVQLRRLQAKRFKRLNCVFFIIISSLLHISHHVVQLSLRRAKSLIISKKEPHDGGCFNDLIYY